MVVCGIDPGKGGAIAFVYDKTNLCEAFDARLTGDLLDVAWLDDLIRDRIPDAIAIEKVASRPGQGVRSVFTFGRVYGMALACAQLSRVPLHYLTPARWKAHFRLPAGSDKEVSRALAKRLYPNTPFTRKKDEARAEAALIARCALDLQRGVTHV